MANHSIVSFCANSGLIFKGSGDKATSGIENWSFLTTSRLIDPYSRKNRSEYPHKPYIARNYGFWRTFLSLTVWGYFHSFYIVVSEIQAEKFSENNGRNRF